MTLTIDSLADFTLGDFRRVAWQAEPVAVGPQGRSRIEGSRADFMRLVASDPADPIYGVTTGYGDKAKTRLDAEGRRKQAELPPYSLGIGLGRRLPGRVVRGIVFARLASFVSGPCRGQPRYRRGGRRHARRPRTPRGRPRRPNRFWRGRAAQRRLRPSDRRRPRREGLRLAGQRRALHRRARGQHGAAGRAPGSRWRTASSHCRSRPAARRWRPTTWRSPRSGPTPTIRRRWRAST